jgi:hypothetical protein
MVGVRRERTVQGDNVGNGEQLRTVDVADARGLARWIGIRDVGNHGAAEPSQDAGNNCADLPRTDDACFLAIEIEAKKSIEGEVAFPHPIVGAVDMAIQCENKSEGTGGCMCCCAKRGMP